ncbi:MAG TPA: hypothetical protein VK817_01940 [Trebonia sp.]|nr:hypothetical protein [Trebonia sp.]
MPTESDAPVTGPSGGDSGTARTKAELRGLRKGRGLGASDLGQRVGPLLREFAGTAAGADQGEVRRALSGALVMGAGTLPEELRTAVLASLGLLPEVRFMAHFGDRVAWLAAWLGRDVRTAQRRIDDAEQLLAEAIAALVAERRRLPGGPAGPDDGWYLAEFAAVLRMDGAAPEAAERRRIVATRPDLAEVTVALDVPRYPGQGRMSVAATVAYGGALERREEPSRSRTHFVIRLPGRLQPGDSHEFEIRLRVPPGERMRPHYVFTPERRCDVVDLRVRFDPRRTPAWIRRVDGETVRMLDDSTADAGDVAIDASGEARVRFTAPAMYLGYGLQWQDPDA